MSKTPQALQRNAGLEVVFYESPEGWVCLVCGRRLTKKMLHAKRCACGATDEVKDE